MHGTYQQDDRDKSRARESRERTQGGQGLQLHGPARRFPAASLTSEQLLAELDLADELGNTTAAYHQSPGALQLHGVFEEQSEGKTISPH